MMRKKKILLVDDEQSILNSFRKDFEYEGYEVTTAASGEEAIMKLQNNHFDLLVTDLSMPGVDGIGVLQEAKKQNPEIGAMILTGFGDMNSAIGALRLGADDYLLKPYDADEILLRVKRCFAKQEVFQKVKLYEKILPVCMYCNSIRDDTGTEPGEGKWLKMSEYLHRKSGVDLSHGICPECMAKHSDDYT
ncbi:MAG: response regulator [Proteobacteria bacterium]|nr:response regulator [Pseudomonadota bacterium]MBU1714228.1 response regulator [Pseudomonadota bacterium]